MKSNDEWNYKKYMNTPSGHGWDLLCKKLNIDIPQYQGRSNRDIFMNLLFYEIF